MFGCGSMAKIEVDFNLKRLANFFKFFLCLSEKSLSTDYSSFFLGEIPSYFLPGVLAISCQQRGFSSTI